MKKLTGLIIFIIFLSYLLKPSPTFALGQKCCEDKFPSITNIQPPLCLYTTLGTSIPTITQITCNISSEDCDTTTNTCIPKYSDAYQKPTCSSGKQVDPCKLTTWNPATKTCQAAGQNTDCQPQCDTTNGWQYSKDVGMCYNQSKLGPNSPQLPGTPAYMKTCTFNGKPVNGVNSAVGCIPTNDLPTFLSFTLKWVLGIAGGIIFLMFLLTGYTFLTSSGNPEKLQAAKENLVSIFSGLILIFFSLILLQTIGADILQLPTF